MSGGITDGTPTIQGISGYEADVTSDNRLMVDVTGTTSSTTAPQSYPMFSISVALNQASSGNDNPLILLKNPVGSGKTLMIWQLFAGVNVTNVSSLFKVFASPTITNNGSSATVASRRIGSGTSPVATAHTLPTVSSSGTLLQNFYMGINQNSLSLVSDFSISVASGSDMLITGNPNSNNREAVFTLIWTEVDE